MAAEVRDVTTRLGAEIRRLMEGQQVSADELSFRTGISRNRLHRILTGNRTKWLHPAELEVIANVLGTTQQHLLREAGFQVDDESI